MWRSLSIVVNPDTVRAQIEGDLIFGLGAALFNEITITGGAVDQSNFHDYRALRIGDSEDRSQVRSNEAPGGIGEVGTGRRRLLWATPFLPPQE